MKLYNVWYWLQHNPVYVGEGGGGRNKTSCELIIVELVDRYREVSRM
jgi:hypothetical protein